MLQTACFQPTLSQTPQWPPPKVTIPSLNALSSLIKSKQREALSNQNGTLSITHSLTRVVPSTITPTLFSRRKTLEKQFLKSLIGSTVLQAIKTASYIKTSWTKWTMRKRASHTLSDYLSTIWEISTNHYMLPQDSIAASLRVMLAVTSFTCHPRVKSRIFTQFGTQLSMPSRTPLQW
jgi:hypothetical protein